MNLRKLLTLVSCVALLVCISVGATLAYLTASTTQVQNTFTVGKVEITLDEAKVDEYGEEEAGADRVMKNEYKLIPGHTYTKDPTVHVDADSEDAWLFVKVENGIADIEATGDTAIATQMTNLGWSVVPNTDNVYAYYDIVKAGDDIPVFKAFTLKTDADVAKYGNAQITIEAYAVQRDTLDGWKAAWTAAPKTEWQKTAED